LTSCYLLALDLADGRLLWARHVASSGGIRSRLARPLSTPAYHEGDIVVATAVGAVARIEATTGQTRWLRRYHPPLSPYFPERQPWEIASPLVTPRGVIALRPDHQRVVLLDWHSGDEIETLSATSRDAWHAPRYLLADDEAVFAVGRDIRAFALDQLEPLMWRFPDERRPGQGSLAYDPDRVEIRGRVQLVDGALLCPTSEGLFFLDTDTGRPMHRLDVELPGNPLASGPQMILAGGDSLQAFMPFARAEQMLRQQIAADPNDPSPALALARLGVRAHDLELALEIADLVIAAIDRRPADPVTQRARQELLEILLDLHRLGLAEGREAGASLHAKIGLVALEPTQRVEHLLAQGDWLQTHSIGQAIEAYQEILSRPDLARAPRKASGTIRTGSSWAAERLAALIEARGPAVYQPQADFARLRLEALTGQPDPEPALLVALAREYPFSEAAIEATREAAVTFAARGQTREAVAALIGLYRLLPVPERASRLLGHEIELALAAGWSGHAQDVLRYVLDVHQDLSLETREGPVAASAWLAEVTAATRPPRPDVGEGHGQAIRLTGALVPMEPGRPPPPDRALLQDGPELLLIVAGGPAIAEPAWRTEVRLPGTPTILRLDEHECLLWYASAPEGPQAVMLDGATGEVKWTTPPWKAAVRERNRARQQDFDADGVRIFATLGPETLYVAHSGGEMFALSLADGRTVRWHHRGQVPLPALREMVFHESGLLLAGDRRSETADPAPAVAILDPTDGRIMVRIEPQVAAEIAWVTVGPLGSVVFGTAGGVEGADLFGGELLFANVTAAAMQTRRGWDAGPAVVVEGLAAAVGEGFNPLRAISATDGSVSDPFDVPIGGEWNRVKLEDLTVDDGRIFAHYGQRIVRYDTSGRVLGADVISDEHDYRWLFVAEDRLVLVSRFKREIVAGEAGREASNVYRLYPLSGNCKLVGEAYQLPSIRQRLQHAVLIDGWLLMSTPNQTLALALPPRPPEGG
jgi:outer membrane protein assembly factor BamB